MAVPTFYVSEKIAEKAYHMYAEGYMEDYMTGFLSPLREEFRCIIESTDLPRLYCVAAGGNEFKFIVCNRTVPYSREEEDLSEFCDGVFDLSSNMININISEEDEPKDQEGSDALIKTVKTVMAVTCMIMNVCDASLFVDLDSEKAGLLVICRGDEVKFKVVSGSRRPKLPTVDGDGKFDGEGETVLPDDEEENFEELLKEAEGGDEVAMEEAALAYLNGDDYYEVEPDPEKAAYWFRRMAELGNPAGCLNLGFLYVEGKGVEKSFEQALYWMKKAEECSDGYAPALMAQIGKADGLRKEIAAGDKAAKAELASVYMALGNAFGDGAGEEFFRKSVALAEEAEADGTAAAHWVLALAFEHGRSVDEDIEKALEHYRRGAELGDASCRHSLGCFYMTGQNVPKDEKKAFELFTKAAEQGNGLAMKSLGACYLFADGVDGDMNKAIYWFEKALEVINDPELALKVNSLKMLPNE